MHYVSVADTCKRGNEPSGSIICGGFLDLLSTGYLLKKDFATWSKLVCTFYAADTKAIEVKLKMESREETVAYFNVLFLNFQFRKIVQSDHPGQIYIIQNVEFATNKLHI